MQNKRCKDNLIDFILENREYYYRLAYSYVRNKEDALDIVQNSICKALSSAKTIENHEAIRTWFYRIVVNSSIDFLRKSKRHIYVEDDVISAMGGSQEDVYKDLDLQEALDRLPTTSKTIISLRYFENMKIEEIASILNENVNTVKTKLYTSLKKLRIDLEADSKV